MNIKTILGWSSALCLSATVLQAQETNELELLRKQLREANDAFQKASEQYRQTMEGLNRRLEQLQGKGVAANPAPAPASATNPPPGAAAAAAPASAWSPSEPLKVLGGQQNFLNLSFDALFAVGSSTADDVEALQLGGHDPNQRGFTVQNLELTLDGKVDPYFRGQANVVMQIDRAGETTIEAEEAYFETMSLPWNLQVKGGQYFSEFGRLNPTHPHTWDFVDQPLVNGRFLGQDGLRNPGARVSWLVPTPFYSELFLGVQNSQGETAHSFRSDHGGDLLFGRPAVETRVKALGDLIYVPRYALSFNPGDDHTVVAGLSAAVGPNGSGVDRDTQIYGADLFYKWKPHRQSKGFPFVTWQTEWLYRRYEAGSFAGDLNHPALPAEVLRDWGIYSQVSYGFRPGWVASIRGDYVTGEHGALRPDPDRDTRWRLAPALTYLPTEFSKIRLQYNYDDRDHVGRDHSVWLQFEFLLGAHAAHKF